VARCSIHTLFSRTMSKPLPRVFYRHRVNLWYDILHGYRTMDTETLKIALRGVLSLTMVAGVFMGEVSGALGFGFATVTSGIDVAAFGHALKETQTEQADSEQTRFS